jgi:hypothetical protein
VAQGALGPHRRPDRRSRPSTYPRPWPRLGALTTRPGHRVSPLQRGRQPASPVHLAALGDCPAPLR